MPKDLRWKIILILVVVFVALLAVFPIRDVVMWEGEVTDTLKRQTKDVSHRAISEREFRSYPAWLWHWLSLGVFHHSREQILAEDEPYVEEGEIRVKRRVRRILSGLKLGLDLRGGSELEYEIPGAELIALSRLPTAVEDAVWEDQRHLALVRSDVSADEIRLTVMLPWATESEARRVQGVLEKFTRPARGSGRAPTLILHGSRGYVLPGLPEPKPFGEGGFQFTSTLARESVPKGSQVDVEEFIRIIRERIDTLGLAEPDIRRAGASRIRVQLPGRDPEEIRRIQDTIEDIGRLEFRLVIDDKAILEKAGFDVNAYFSGGLGVSEARRPALEQVAKAAQATKREFHLYAFEHQTQTGTEKLYLLISDRIELTGDHIRSASVDTGEQGLEIQLNFDALGSRRFGDLTERNVDRHLAILMDDRRSAGGKLQAKESGEPYGMLYSAPRIIQAIRDGRARITGYFSRETAKRLETVLRSGRLPGNLYLRDKLTIGAGLGEHSIRSGQRAILIGLTLVLLTVGIYYLKAGLIADAALLINLTLLVGALAVLNATLTLPGIAGIILTVGMSVDANVLIFERIREERTKRPDRPKPLLLAMSDGYQRAFSTIFDANITTLLTALILYYVGSGPIRGFAVTLGLGISFSMFTALFVTRVIMELWLRRRSGQRLHMLQLIRATQIPFLKFRRVALGASLLAVVIGMGIVALRGEGMLGLDFTGGISTNVLFKNPVDIREVRERLAAAGVRTAEVQRIALMTEEAEPNGAGMKSRQFEIAFKEQEVVVSREIASIQAASPAGPAAGAVVRVNSRSPLDPAKEEARLTQAGFAGEVQGLGAAAPDGTFLAMEIRLKKARHDELRRLVRVLRTGASVEAFLRDVFRDLLVEDGLQIGDLKAGRTTVRLVTLEPIEPETVEAVFAEAGCTAVERLAPAVGKVPATEFTYEVTPAGAEALGLKALREDIRKRLVVADPFMRLRKISGQVAAQMQLRALFAIILALGMIVAYIWFRFQLQFGLAAIVALAHDVLITLGVLAIFGKEINLRIVAALLTIIGYSLNDTIVVFDRIRENMGILRGRLFGEIINISINQTLARTLLTSLTTLMAVGALFVWGGEVIRDFAFALIVGVIVGTYSSVFIASPILLVGRKKGPAGARL